MVGEARRTVPTDPGRAAFEDRATRDCRHGSNSAGSGIERPPGRVPPAAVNLAESVVRYFVNLKFAWWIVPSMNFTVSVRHVLTHNLSVFQT